MVKIWTEAGVMQGTTSYGDQRENSIEVDLTYFE